MRRLFSLPTLRNINDFSIFTVLMRLEGNLTRAYEQQNEHSARRDHIRRRRPQGVVSAQCRRREISATHDQGSDKPGRLFAGANARDRRGAIEATDWHELEEQRFARMVAEAFEKLVRERKVKAVVIAAPPRTLAELRQAFHPDVKARIMAEVDKDLTKHPVYEIEKHLVG
jgi:protein required for attachment to host cells